MADVLISLGGFYERLVNRKDFLLEGDCHDEVRAFTIRLKDMVYNSRMQISRAKSKNRW